MDSLQPKKFKILLIGDDCNDVYEYGTIDRISPEAPVPIFKFNYREERRGMAGNVCNNLLNLGCSVTYAHKSPSVKTRLIDLKSRQHIVRIDADAPSEAIELNELEFDIDDYAAIVISDYNKGAVSYDLVEQIRKITPVPIFVDSKKTDLSRFEGCFVKINSLEYSLAKTVPTELIVTMSGDGVQYKNTTYYTPKIEVVDVTGAGDTFLAALCYEYLNTQNMGKAIEFAILASAVTVQHNGVYAPTHEEIRCV